MWTAVQVNIGAQVGLFVVGFLFDEYNKRFYNIVTKRFHCRRRYRNWLSRKNTALVFWFFVLKKR
jgi:hypothetical protein